MSTAAVEHAFHRCAQLLQELHHLIAAGQDDSNEAEALRAEMDALWYAMDEAERDRFGGLSEDLYIQATRSAEELARWTEQATIILAHDEFPTYVRCTGRSN